MGNSCYQLQSQSMGNKTIDLKHDNLTIIEDDEDDNPQRTILSSKFLQTNISASNNLLNKSHQNYKTYQNDSHLQTSDKNNLNQNNFSIPKIRKLPTIKINIQDFVEINKKNIKKKYKILQKIGEGTFGEVFKAENVQTKDIRAIKIIKRSDLEKKKQEIEILKSCDHPNIVQIYQVFEEQFYSYVVMQYCPGGSIINLIKQQSFGYHEDEAKTVMEQTLHALVYLHGKGIVHRDIKLENVVFVESGPGKKITSNLKIIDFGMAQKIKFKVNKESQIGGTTIYMPPQAFSGWYSRAFDIWSCGIMLYILLTGSYPFKGKNKIEITSSIKNTQPAFTQNAWKNISDEAKILVKLMLMKDFIKRPTAEQCLQNVWFSACIKRSETKRASTKLMKNLTKYYAINNFVSVVESYLSFLKMSISQRCEIKKMFQALDVKRKGALTKKDLMHIELISGEFDQNMISNLIQAADKNKTGSIQFSQFQAFMSNKKKLFIESSLREAFYYFDIDGSGYIQRNELISCLKGCEGDVDVLITEIDKDGDLKVSLNQFLEYFQKVQNNINNEL